MNNKKYRCFSYPLMQHLLKNNIAPEGMTLHSETGKTVWIYECDDALSKLLTEWSNNKPTIVK